MTYDWIPQSFRDEKKMYLGIARAIESDISTGVLRPGDILPTHRDLADRLGVAIGTVTKAYKEAEKKSLIVGRGRKGTFVRNQDRSESALAREIRLWSCDDDPVYTLAYGVKIPDFNSILRKYVSIPKANPKKYWPPESHRPQHYETGVRWIKKLGLELDPDEVVLTHGNHHGLMVSLATETTPGDVIAAEKHTFISLRAIAEFLGLKVVGVDADSEGLLPDAFEATCRRDRIKTVLCMPCVQNPTNGSMSEERRRAIAQIAQRYDVMIIEDEVTRAVADNPPPLLKSLAPDHCYLLASPSKVLTPGLKIGYIVPPPLSKTQLLNNLRASIGFTGGLPSEILGQMLRDGSADRYLSECKREGQIRQRLARKCLPSSLVHTNPSSYFVWLELPEHWNASECAAEVYKLGTPAWAASSYAVDPANAARAIRFTIGQAPNQAAFAEALRNIANLIESPPHSEPKN